MQLLLLVFGVLIKAKPWVIFCAPMTSLFRLRFLRAIAFYLGFWLRSFSHICSLVIYLSENNRWILSSLNWDFRSSPICTVSLQSKNNLGLIIRKSNELKSLMVVWLFRISVSWRLGSFSIRSRSSSLQLLISVFLLNSQKSARLGRQIPGHPSQKFLSRKNISLRNPGKQPRNWAEIILRLIKPLNKHRLP